MDKKLYTEEQVKLIIEKTLEEGQKEIVRYVTDHVLVKLGKMSDIKLHAPKQGRAWGAKKWGALDYWEIVWNTAKIAPISRRCFLMRSVWDEALARCLDRGLLKPCQTPRGAFYTSDHWVEVNAKPSVATVPIDAFDYLMMKDMLARGNISANDFAISVPKKHQTDPRGKLADVCQRLRHLADLGLIVADVECQEGWSGKFRPTWYRATEKADDLFLLM